MLFISHYPIITSGCALTGLIAYSIFLITFTATVFTNTPIVVIAYDSGTYAFVILINLKSDEPTIAVHCGGNMPNPAEFIDMDSHRPESAALYAALCFVQELLARFPRGPLTGDLPPL